MTTIHEDEQAVKASLMRHIRQFLAELSEKRVAMRMELIELESRILEVLEAQS